MTSLREYPEGFTGWFVGPDGEAHLLHIGWDGPDRCNAWWKQCETEIVGSAGGDSIQDKFCYGPEGWEDYRDTVGYTMCPKCEELENKAKPHVVITLANGEKLVRPLSDFPGMDYIVATIASEGHDVIGATFKVVEERPE